MREVGEGVMDHLTGGWQCFSRRWLRAGGRFADLSGNNGRVDKRKEHKRKSQNKKNRHPNGTKTR